MAEAVGAKEHGAEAVQGRALAFTLYALVFCTGAAALATEIGAARLLAPYYGSSTIVWANVIGLVLAALSVGYWVGGKIADRSPSPRVLGRIVVFAAVLIAIIPFAAGPFLDVSVRGLDQVSAGAAIGSFFAVLALFAPALTLLGMVAPFAIRLAIDDVRDAGSVAGRLYALSTVGSLLGTFLAALVLIPTIGTRRTLLAAALLVALSGAALLGRRWLLVAAGVGALIAIPAGAVRAEPGLIYEHESRYQFIHVTERNGVRRLYLNEGLAVHSLWRPNTVLTGGEWDTYLAVPPLLGPTAAASRDPRQRRRHDGPRDGRLLPARAHRRGRARPGRDRGRPPLLRSGRQPPAACDHGRRAPVPAPDPQPVRPDHRRRLPAARTCRSTLRRRSSSAWPGRASLQAARSSSTSGRRPMTTASPRASPEPSRRSSRSSSRGRPLHFNQFVIGLDRPEPRAVLVRRLSHGPRRLRSLTSLLAGQMRIAAPSSDPWTDDRAPVEWITDRMILEFAARGGRFEEYPLPTAP